MPWNMAPTPVKGLEIKLFAGGHKRARILRMNENPLICGFITNPIRAATPLRLSSDKDP